MTGITRDTAVRILALETCGFEFSDALVHEAEEWVRRDLTITGEEIVRATIAWLDNPECWLGSDEAADR